MSVKQIKRLSEAIELIAIQNRVVIEHQQEMIKMLSEMLEQKTANTKLSPADAWAINFALSLQKPESEDNCKEDPYIHTHGIC